MIYGTALIVHVTYPVVIIGTRFNAGFNFGGVRNDDCSNAFIIFAITVLLSAGNSSRVAEQIFVKLYIMQFY
jgi:hypothetical protein